MKWTTPLACAVIVAASAAGTPIKTTAAPIAAPAVMTMLPMPAATRALDARLLRARRTAGGYVLSGQVLVKDACQAARFERFLGTVFPPLFDAVHYRRRSAMGLMCMPRPIWVTASPLAVTSAAPPRYVTVQTQKGSTRVPVR